ncbi:MAG TPA: hypothetical protein VJU86_21970 [Pyrinomonadaceae bacterium]|nr:hypothetical protein [Pyrinomonadaceae bacterium]
MNKALSVIAFGIFLLTTSLAINGSTAQLQSEKLMELGKYNCEDEMSKLDYLAVQLQEKPETFTYIVVYGGRRGMRLDEVEVRAARMRRYLVETRGISLDRVVVANGGFRENLTVEFWLVPRGVKPPTVTPGVARKNVKFKKGKFRRMEEPGCFPDKLPVAKPRPA